MSSNLLDAIGPVVDIKINNIVVEQDLSIDVEIGKGTVVREFVVPDTHQECNVSFVYKNNDTSLDFSEDRNFIIEKIEISSNGEDFRPVPNPTALLAATGKSDLRVNMAEYKIIGYKEFDYSILTPGWESLPVLYFLKMWKNGTGTYKITFE